jgi:hypothetical protein
MKVKCPDCEDTVMVLESDEHKCPDCETVLTITEAEELFNDGKLVGILDEATAKKIKVDPEAVDGNNDTAMEEDDDEDDDDDGDKKKNPFAKKSDGKGGKDDDGDDDDDARKDLFGKKKDEMKKESFNGFENQDTWATTVIIENEYSVYKQAKTAYKKEKLDERFIKSLIAKDELFEGVDLEQINLEEITEHIQDVMVEADKIALDVTTVLFAESDLDDEEKEKLVDIFESAVDVRVNEVKLGLMEEQEQRIAEAIEIKEQELQDGVSRYVDHIVQEWYEENKIQIEESRKVEFAEDFIDGLKDLFEQYYIDVPADRYDIVEGLDGKITELEEELQKINEDNEALRESIITAKKSQIVDELVEGLVDTQKERVVALAETVEYKNDEDFKAGVIKLKEAFLQENKGAKRPNLDPATPKAKEENLFEGRPSLAGVLSHLSSDE